MGMDIRAAYKKAGKGFCFFVLFLLSVPCFADEVYTIDYPPVNYGNGKNKALIDKGEYLAKAGDCIACHTNGKDKGAAYAGDLAIATPFGTFFSPNISPDKETGIGNWTEEQFMRAMHDGVNAKGQNLFPVFPYVSFNKVSKEDLQALYAYFMAIPAVKHTPRKDTVPFPFNVRLGQYGWKILFFYPYSGYFKEDPQQSAEWNRGAYLVNGLGHCTMCHTPINLLGANKRAYFLAGGPVIDNYPAPNINSEALGNVPDEEIIEVFTKNKMLGGGQVQGPMLDVNMNSLRYLSHEDLQAIVTYLKTVKSKSLPKPKPGSGGRGTYDAYCAVCHGTGAAGAPVVGNAADWAPRIKEGRDVLDDHAIKGYLAMPAKGSCRSCTDEEIKEAVSYMVDNSQGAAGEAAPKSKIMPRPTLEDGKRVYDQVCSVCHAQGLLGAPKVGDKKVWEPIIEQNMDILFDHAVNGYRRMPPKGTCIECSEADVQAAVIYMVQQSKESGDYLLWLK